MSFGFSVGDFLTLAQLAWSVYSSCKDSSREFKNIAGQVNSLHFILNSTAEHLLQQPLETYEATELASIKTRCQDILADINCLLQRHRSLGTQKPRIRDMIKWGLGNAMHFKDKLLFHATVLAALNASLTQFSQARVEKNLNLLIRKIDRGNPGSGRSAGGSSEAKLALPTQDILLDHLENKPSISEFTDEDAYSESSRTLTNDSEVSREGSPLTPSSSVQSSPVISDNDSFSRSSTTASDRGDERGHIYQGVKVTDESIQINGDMFTSHPIRRAPRNYYVGATASGKSWQFNGNLDLEPFLEFIKVR